MRIAYVYGTNYDDCAYGDKPIEGLKGVSKDKKERFRDILLYDRKLSKKECKKYSLTYIKTTDYDNVNSEFFFFGF